MLISLKISRFTLHYVYIYLHLHIYKKTLLIQVNKESKYTGVTFINICAKIRNKNYIYNTWPEEFNFKYHEKKAQRRCRIFS